MFFLKIFYWKKKNEIYNCWHWKVISPYSPFPHIGLGTYYFLLPYAFALIFQKTLWKKVEKNERKWKRMKVKVWKTSIPMPMIQIYISFLKRMKSVPIFKACKSNYKILYFVDFFYRTELPEFKHLRFFLLLVLQN